MKKESVLTTLTSKSSWLTRPRASNFWQAAFVRPFPLGKDFAFKRFKGLLAYGFGLIFIIAPIEGLIDGALSTPVQLTQMQKDEGTIIDIALSRRQGTGSFIVRFSTGEERKYFAVHMALIELRKGEQVLVWNQKGFRLFNGVIQKACEILIIDRHVYVFDYTKTLAWRVERHKQIVWWNWAFLFFGVFLITRPWWTHRKAVLQIQQA